MVIATIPARYAAPQTARTLSIALSSVFESRAAFLQRFLFLYRVHYTHLRGDFNRFVQFTFPVFIDSAQFHSSFVNCRMLFLQFILHFPAASRCCFSCKIARSAPNMPGLYAGIAPPSSRARCFPARLPAHFPKAPSFFEAETCKNRQGPAKVPAGLISFRQKFVKFRHKRSLYTTISYSPMPPEEK